jgi:hypothetical protein
VIVLGSTQEIEPTSPLLTALFCNPQIWQDGDLARIDLHYSFR